MKYGKEMRGNVFCAVQDMIWNGIMIYLSAVEGVTPQIISGFFAKIVIEKNRGKLNNLLLAWTGSRFRKIN